MCTRESASMQIKNNSMCVRQRDVWKRGRKKQIGEIERERRGELRREVINSIQTSPKHSPSHRWIHLYPSLFKILYIIEHVMPVMHNKRFLVDVEKVHCLRVEKNWQRVLNLSNPMRIPITFQPPCIRLFEVEKVVADNGLRPQLAAS